MADISQIKATDGVTYNIKDATARNTLINMNKEAYISWGGQNFSGSYSPIDAAMVDVLGANRLMFAKAAGITVEYSRDTGSTWTDYGLTDTQKVALFSSGGSALIGKADSTNKATANGAKYQLRITLSTSEASVYTALHKFVFYISTSGSNNCTCTIQKALQSTPTTFENVVTDVPINGWSGYNVINVPTITTYGNSPNSQYGKIRFIFKANGGNTNYNGLTITKILGFGGMGWTTPSTYASTGHLYSFDADQNATFPAKVNVIGTLTQNGTAVSLNGHTHPTSIATSTGTSALTMSHGGKYALTAGGNSFIFTLPADSNTDTKVTQTATTTSANYEVLFSATADNTTRTETAGKSANLLFNPNTGALTFGNATTAQLISKTPSRTAAFLTIGGSKKTAGTVDGTSIRLGAGGATFIGSGEYADNRYNVADIADGDEVLYMGSDGAAYIETNAQTIGSRKTFTFGSDGTFNSPSTIKQNGTAVSLSGHTHSFTPAGTIAVQTAGTTTSITPVTKKTVVTGGSTTDIPNISKKTVVTSASGATATYSNGILTITNGSFGTGDSVTVGTAIKAYTSLTTGDSVTVGTAVTVKTGDAAYKFTGTAGTTGTASA